MSSLKHFVLCGDLNALNKALGGLANKSGKTIEEFLVASSTCLLNQGLGANFRSETYDSEDLLDYVLASPSLASKLTFRAWFQPYKRPLLRRHDILHAPFSLSVSSTKQIRLKLCASRLASFCWVPKWAITSSPWISLWHQHPSIWTSLSYYRS